jgi:hypothetical protein
MSNRNEIRNLSNINNLDPKTVALRNRKTSSYFPVDPINRWPIPSDFEFGFLDSSADLRADRGNLVQFDHEDEKQWSGFAGDFLFD